MGAVVGSLRLGALDGAGEEGKDGLKVHRSGHSAATSEALQLKKGQKSGSLPWSLSVFPGPRSLSPEPEPLPASSVSSVGNRVGRADGNGDGAASVCGAVAEPRLFVVVRGAAEVWPPATVM